MGITDDGVIPDVRMDCLGVLGRLNSGQCIEQELNWMADTILKKIKEEKNKKKQLSILLKFIKMVDKNEYDEMVEYLDNCSDEEKNEFMDDIINDRIYIMQSPLTGVSGDDLYRLYNEINPEKTYIHYKDENGREYKSLRKMIVADEYILRLKQEPITKISIRSKSLINPRTFLPIKSTKASKHKIIYPDQSNRIGEQELNILMLSNDSDALDYFYRSHSSSVTGRRSTALFENDPDDGFIIDMESDNSRVVDMFNAYLKTMGLKLDIQCDESENNKSVDIECDIPKIPQYIKNLF